MKWDYIATGLALVGIGIALLLAPLPPTWWPSMSKGLIQAVFALGLLILLAGLGIAAIGISPAFKDRSLWPQTGMVIFAAGFIICGVWWYYEPSEPHVEAASDIPHLAVSLVIDTLNEDEPNFHIEAENIQGPQVTVRSYSYRSPKFSDVVLIPVNKRTIIPKSGKVTLPGKLYTGIIVPPTNLELALVYEISSEPKKDYTSTYRFFVDRSVKAADRFSPVSWQEKSGSPDTQSTTKDILDGFLKPVGTASFTFFEKNPDGSPNILDIHTQYRRIVVYPTSRVVQFFSIFRPYQKVETIEVPIEKNENGVHVLIVSWDDDKQKITLMIDGKETTN